MDHSDLTVFNFMGNSIGAQRVKENKYLSLSTVKVFKTYCLKFNKRRMNLVGNIAL